MGEHVKHLSKCIGLISVVSCCALATHSFAIDLFEEDAMGNINQRNVGSYKSNRFGMNNANNEGEVVKRIKPLQPYATLNLEVPVELAYSESGNPRVEIEASQEAINKINFIYSGNRLTIKSNGFSTNTPIKLSLYGSDLQRVFINSAADVVLRDIAVSDFFLSVRGAADVEVQGSVRGCQINTQGASDLNLEQLKCQTVTLVAQGSSDIVLFAAKSIKGRVQGAGDVAVLGNPSRRKLEVMGVYDLDYQ